MIQNVFFLFKIGNRFALTAAHCLFDDDKQDVLPASSFSIILGVHDRSNSSEQFRWFIPQTCLVILNINTWQNNQTSPIGYFMCYGACFGPHVFWSMQVLKCLSVLRLQFYYQCKTGRRSESSRSFCTPSLKSRTTRLMTLSFWNLVIKPHWCSSKRVTYDNLQEPGLICQPSVLPASQAVILTIFLEKRVMSTVSSFWNGSCP